MVVEWKHEMAVTVRVSEWKYEFHSQSLPIGYLGQVSRTEISTVIQNLATIDCCSFQTHPACIIRNQTIKLFEEYNICRIPYSAIPNSILGEPQEMHFTGPQSASENLGKLHCLRWKLQRIQELGICFSPFEFFGLFYLNAEELEKCFKLMSRLGIC